jgi:hypothetical protein
MVQKKECDQFLSNKFAKSGKVARKCMNCGRDIQEHRASAVPSSSIMKALEANASEASMVFEQGGKLFLGGFVAAMNEPFLTKNGITVVVNTAKGTVWGTRDSFAHSILLIVVFNTSCRL